MNTWTNKMRSKIWLDTRVKSAILLRRYGSFIYVLGISFFITGTVLIALNNGNVHVTVSFGNTKLKTILYRTEEENLNITKHGRVVKRICKITITEEMDLMKMKRHPFIKKFKNPCWYEQSNLQCLPYVYLAGVAKCGTTDLFKRIMLHPDFVPPTVKEPRWLSSGRFWRKEKFSYYTWTFFSPISEALSKTNSTNLITGDASINTLEGSHFWRYLGANIGYDEPVENNPEYIYHLNKEARIIINIRNPVDRLWSEYLAFSRSNNKSAERFHEIVTKEILVYKACLEVRSLRACMYDRPLAMYATAAGEEGHVSDDDCNNKPIDIVILRRGVYHVFIKDYLKVFPRQHVLIQRLEDISLDPERALIRAYEFLGLKILSKAKMQKIVNLDVRNSRRPEDKDKGDMLGSTRKLLYEFYKPHNEQLADLLKDSKYNYGSRG